jgi:hypothetical protein
MPQRCDVCEAGLEKPYYGVFLEDDWIFMCQDCWLRWKVEGSHLSEECIWSDCFLGALWICEKIEEVPEEGMIGDFVFALCDEHKEKMLSEESGYSCRQIEKDVV